MHKNRDHGDARKLAQEADNCRNRSIFPASQSQPQPQSPRRVKVMIRAFVRSLIAIDYTQAALIPGMRTAAIIVVDWVVFGIGNSNTTAFQLGCLYVGLTDPNGNLTRRLHDMGLTLLSVMLMGTLIPALTFESIPGTILAAFAVAYCAGCAPLLGDPALVLALKLGTALFAIQSAVNRNTNGYGGIANALLWTFLGGFSSLLAALIPEIVGNRDAIRTDLFKVWHGFGKNLGYWSAKWGTSRHTSHTMVPTVTLSIYRTLDCIVQDDNEDPKAKEWLVTIMDHVEIIRTTALCLSNSYEMVRQQSKQTYRTSSTSTESQELEELMNCLFKALGRTVRDVGFAFQFPWLVRYFPFLRRRVMKRADQFEKAADAVKNKVVAAMVGDGHERNAVTENTALTWLPTLVTILQTDVENSLQLILASESWPRFSSILSLPRRFCAALPPKLPTIQDDPGWAIKGYAFRFALAFMLATLPELLLPRGSSGHWFPMTLALIMGPSYTTTYEKVAHRTIGTLFGIALGSAISPLFQFPQLLILLLGLNTYAVCVFFQANYAVFTLFITSWVLCTTVGVGSPMGITIVYRCIWTLAAAIVALLVTYTYPPTTEFNLTEKLAATTRAILIFAKSVLEEHKLLQQPQVEDKERHANILRQAAKRVQDAKLGATQARLSLFTDMHHAVLMPTEGYRIDPHSVAPQLASDLIDIVVIPVFLSLVKDASANHLLSDLYDLQELERLVRRLEAQASSPLRSAARTFEVVMTPAFKGGGPFKKAVASAHRRLDTAGVPDAFTPICPAGTTVR